MTTRLTLTATSLALGMAVLTPAQAKVQVQTQDGYDAPADWPSPITDHNTGTARFDRLEYAVPDEGEESLVWDFQAWPCVPT